VPGGEIRQSAIIAVIQCAMTSNQPWWLTWPVEEVAAAILPVFGHQVRSCPYQDEDVVLRDIVAWCKTGRFAEQKPFSDLPGLKRFTDADYRALNEAIQVLEQTRLIVRSISGRDITRCYLGLTRLGILALQTDTVRQHLGLGADPPAT
jgi:hypothetical protein